MSATIQALADGGGGDGEPCPSDDGRAFVEMFERQGSAALAELQAAERLLNEGGRAMMEDKPLQVRGRGPRVAISTLPSVNLPLK